MLINSRRAHCKIIVTIWPVGAFIMLTVRKRSAAMQKFHRQRRFDMDLAHNYEGTEQLQIIKIRRKSK